MRYIAVSALLVGALQLFAMPSGAKDIRQHQVAALKELLAFTAQAQKADDELILQIDTVADGLEKHFKRRKNRGRMPLSDYEVQTLKKDLAGMLEANPYQANSVLNPAGIQQPGTPSQDGSAATKSTTSGSPSPPSPADLASSSQTSSSTLSNHPQSGIALSTNPDEILAAFNQKKAQTAADELSKANRQAWSPFVVAKKDEQSSRFAKDRLVISFDAAMAASNAQALRAKMPDTYKDLAGSIHVIFNDQDTAFIWGADYSGRPVFDRTKKRYKLVAITWQSY